MVHISFQFKLMILSGSKRTIKKHKL